MKTPQEILLDNELVITMINVHHYVPSKDHGHFRQVVGALQQITGTNYDPGCSGCMSEIGRIAQIHLDAYKAKLKNEAAKFYTFPDKKPGVGQIVEGFVKECKPENGDTVDMPAKKKGGRPAGSKNKPK